MLKKTLTGFLIVGFVALVAVAGIAIRIRNSKTVNQNVPLDSATQTSLQNAVVPLAVNEDLIKETLKSSLSKVALKPEYGGSVFCSNHLYGFDEDKDSKMISVYVWVYCEEYFKEAQDIKMGSGVSYPIKVAMEIQKGTLGIQGIEVPQDGEGYASSIRDMFPDQYETEAINGFDVALLYPTPKQQAGEYFK